MEYRLLSAIKSPADVKKLDESELPELAAEIRDQMIHTVSVSGGHLSSNLGVVELTIALHRVFRSPEDKIIWDVGHQCYAHKMLTGRFDRFDTLRAPDGISGFTRRYESEHDIFSGGHSSVALSAAYGIAEANKLKKNKNYTIAVVGDGAFTGGMVYEALNNAGHAGTGTKLIVILNDNEMSISKNVGALAKYFATIRANPRYFRLKAKTENVLNHIPLIGRKLAKILFRLKTSLKNRIYKSTMFEDMGFRYIGPIDGHSIPHLVDALRGAVEANYPVILHINTVKGKGYELAEQNPDRFHGISAFNIETGEKKLSAKSFSDAFGEFMCAAAEKDKRICAVTAAMSLGTGLENFGKVFPQRFFDVGIAEQHAVTFAAGLARGGMLPVVAVYSTFLQRAYDQIIHDCAMQQLKIVLAVDRAGFVGDDGESHHGLFDPAYLNSIPDITVYAPATFREMEHSFYEAFYKTEGSVAVRYPRGVEPQLPEEYTYTGEDWQCTGDPADIAIVTYGRCYAEALEARRRLAEEGVRVMVVKLTRIKPVPKEAVQFAMQAERIFFFEEAQRYGGIGETFADKLFQYGYRGFYRNTGIQGQFAAQNTVQGLLKFYQLDAESMVQAIKESEET
ncbi:MAG: 1-deoxy-D-xylulose-5-phosphate synthase [Clostridia bacterium]|nr:1-deoxy-D-xylulose-5-phosphate synthase [Clostridia bacterium]MBQ9506031.1 1-deoxy-D-xylulose-5-phosphate synthase [Clostridia bacterium]